MWPQARARIMPRASDMKALPTLIRLAKRDLDILRGALSEIEAKRANAIARLAAHAEALAQEQRVALQNYEAGRAYGGFAALALTQRRALEAERDQLAMEADRIRALITEAHVELKKVEHLAELQAKREAAEAARRDDAALDEIATQRAVRRAP